MPKRAKGRNKTKSVPRPKKNRSCGDWCQRKRKINAGGERLASTRKNNKDEEKNAPRVSCIGKKNTPQEG